MCGIQANDKDNPPRAEVTIMSELEGGRVDPLVSQFMGCFMWHEINTAPQDGSCFITWDGSRMEVMNWPPGYSLGRWDWMGDRWGGSSTCWKPTHWTPVPDVPKIEKCSWCGSLGVIASRFDSIDVRLCRKCLDESRGTKMCMSDTD